MPLEFFLYFLFFGGKGERRMRKLQGFFGFGCIGNPLRQAARLNYDSACLSFFFS